MLDKCTKANLDFQHAQTNDEMRSFEFNKGPSGYHQAALCVDANMSCKDRTCPAKRGNCCKFPAPLPHCCEYKPNVEFRCQSRSFHHKQMRAWM